MLFDDEEQIEVRHVISLAHHSVTVYSGGGVTPEGELWIKRNAICLSRTDGAELGLDGQVSKPFYLFSENCSAKEDFYFALLKNQEQTFGASTSAPTPKHFDVKNIISLVQKLHSNEDNIHSRWLNAMLGRAFLALYKTKDLENYISEKITKKISRVKKPSFLTNINIQKIDIGEAAPFFSNLKLKDLTVEGECVMEADVRYTGNFRLEVAATAKIDLGTRFKAREVNLILAVVLKKIEGHVLFKIKPPPSNRVWVSFQTMPKMETVIEPIVSSRQITYTLILRQIENRIKEVVAETLVQPFWDDIPFFKTEHKKWRGGIFENDDAVEAGAKGVEASLAQAGDVDAVERIEEGGDLSAETRPMEKSHSMPLVDASQSVTTGLFGRKLGKSSNGPTPSASSTSIDAKPPSSAAPSPKTLNHAPEPVVATDASHADIFKPSSSPPDHATSYMAAIHSRSQDALSTVSPSGSPAKPFPVIQTPSFSSASSADYNKDGDKEKENDSETTSIPIGRRNTSSSVGSASTGGEQTEPHGNTFKHQAGSLGRSFFMRRENSNLSAASLSGESNGSSQKKNTLAAVTNAAAQARQWGWNAIQRQKDARKNSDAARQPVDLSQPMGRGQPLPPPGTPLPGPTNGKTKIGPIPVPKRKPVPGQQGTDRASDGSSEETHASISPRPNRRRRGASHDAEDDGEHGMLVVAAPDDSEPDTPGVENRAEYLATSEGASITTAEATDDAASSKFTVDTTQLSTPPTEPMRAESSVPEKEESNLVKTGSPPQEEESPAEAESLDMTPPMAPTATEAGEEDDFSGWMEDDGNMELELEEPQKHDSALETAPTLVASEVKT